LDHSNSGNPPFRIWLQKSFLLSVGLVAIIDLSNTENVVKNFFQYKFCWLHHILFVAERKSVRVI
jgi:hypothetical protein